MLHRVIRSVGYAVFLIFTPWSWDTVVAEQPGMDDASPSSLASDGTFVFNPSSDGMFVPNPSLDDEQIATKDYPLFVSGTYFIWTRGRISGTLNIGLNPARRYLITGALTGKAGGDYGQIYIYTICFPRSIDQIVCEVVDDPSPNSNIASLGINRTVEGATRVTVKLRGDGGLHRAEGVVFDITY